MREQIESIFSGEGIEFFAARDYSELCEINPGLGKRCGVTARSAFIFLVPYYVGEGENLSTYSTSLDYHIYIRELTARIISALSELYPEGHFWGFGDHSPIDERHAALTSGLGIAGENGLLINEKYGTYIFIGDIITDLPPERIFASLPKPVLSCEGCGACKSACATGILSGESRECLSAITQKRGELSEGEVALMRKYNTVWGCDLCQRACPHNADPVITPIDFFKKDRISELTTDKINSMSDEQFRERAFAWRGRAVVLRNLAKLDY